MASPSWFSQMSSAKSPPVSCMGLPPGNISWYARWLEADPPDT